MHWFSSIQIGALAVLVQAGPVKRQEGGQPRFNPDPLKGFDDPTVDIANPAFGTVSNSIYDCLAECSLTRCLSRQSQRDTKAHSHQDTSKNSWDQQICYAAASFRLVHNPITRCRYTIASALMAKDTGG